MQDCKLPGYENYSFEESAHIMSEVIRTLIDSWRFEYGSVGSMYIMHKAVKSSAAYTAWTDGECVKPPSPFDTSLPAPDAIYRLSFD